MVKQQWKQTSNWIKKVNRKKMSKHDKKQTILIVLFWWLIIPKWFAVKIWKALKGEEPFFVKSKKMK